MTIHSRVVSLIEQIGRMMKEHVCDIDAEECKLTVNQVMVLYLLDARDRLAMADIAHALHITPASATSLVNRMVDSGWLSRAGDPNDRRKVWVSIHPDRKTSVIKRKEEHRRKMQEFNSVLSEDQLKQLADILQVLVDRNS